MYSKLYTLKFGSQINAKIAAAYITEELGGGLADDEIAALEVAVDTEGTVVLNVRFDSPADLKKFVRRRETFIEDLRESFPFKADKFQTVTIFDYKRTPKVSVH